MKHFWCSRIARARQDKSVPMHAIDHPTMHSADPVAAIEASGCPSVCGPALGALANAMRHANSLPAGVLLELVHATSAETANEAQLVERRALSMVRALADRYAARESDGDSDTEGLFDVTVDAAEAALELVNSSLDRAAGIRDAGVIDVALAPGPNRISAPRTGYPGSALSMSKPQHRFPDFPIDNSDTPFVPPYGTVRSSIESATGVRNGTGSGPGAASETGADIDRYLEDLFKSNAKEGAGCAAGTKHPYEDEIAAAASDMACTRHDAADITVFRPLGETPCTFVDTEEELFEVTERLRVAAEIAVDLENHSVRSFQGFTCLIQISTRKEDFLIDALALRGSIHRALAPVFADASTVKVLHGADRDSQWLERDFGIYVVNLFDTGQACKRLKYPSASLAYLLTKFCDVSMSTMEKKRFQLSDWRERPLSESMLAYARSDTHYLLYVYDRLRAELTAKNGLSEVWERSADIARRRHRKARFNPTMGADLCAKNGLCFDAHQVRVLNELCQWRDRTAREEDESLQYVLPLRTMFTLVRSRDKARTAKSLLEEALPGKHTPPLVKAHAAKLAQLVSDALDAKFEPTVKTNDAMKTATVALGARGVMKGKGGDTDGVRIMKSAGTAINISGQLGQAVDTVRAGHGIDAASFLPSSVPSNQMTGANLRAVAVRAKRQSMLMHDTDDDSFNSDNDATGTFSGKIKETAGLDGIVPSTSSAPTRADRSVEVDVVPVRAAVKSVFDLGSDSESESDDHQNARRKLEVQARSTIVICDREQTKTADTAVASVLASLSASVPQATTAFINSRTEQSGGAVQHCEGNLSQKKLQSQPEEKEISYISLLESAGDLSKVETGNRRRRRAKRKVLDVESEKKAAESVLPAFDYAAAMATDSAKYRKINAYDPLSKLKPGNGEEEGAKRRAKRARKAPRSGEKSMSFKTRR